MNKFAWIIIILGLLSLPALGQEKAAKKKKGKQLRNEQFSTSYDFEESVLQGQMKVPLSMVLKGRREASKGQIIELRKNFRNELRSSRPGVLRHSR